VDINAQSNAINKVANKHINIIPAEKYVKKSEQIVDTLVVNTVIRVKSVFSSLVRLRFS